MPGPHSLWLLFVLAVSTSGSQLQAQQVGDRVRVYASGAMYVGQVTAVSDDRLDISDGTRAWSLAFSGMSLLELSTGTQSRWREGLLYGAKVGAYGGGVVGFVVANMCAFFTVWTFDEECYKVTFKMTLATGAILATVGGLAGMGIGSLIKTDTWTPIPFSDRKIEYAPTIRPQLGPDGGLGLSFGVRIRF